MILAMVLRLSPSWAMVASPVTVTDITDKEQEFALDTHGFQLVVHRDESQARQEGYQNDSEVKLSYYAEMEQLIKNVLGAGNQSLRGPILRAHVDQSYKGAEYDLRWYLPDEADTLLAGRPIKPVYKDPLAVADATTVAEADLIPARIIFEDHERESWTVKHSPSHRWYFKYGQQPDEVLLIKCFDSREDVARRAPHSAFQNPRHVDEPWRESIEIRTMVFYGDQ
ncbi:unnamed protein product [Parascedosporium putredinis]|uniref:Methyltransferase n=1 Tax=Parascedosporium putredinis TaxID=1442378 RepID=A0A9P1GYN1_9PEZI|nr:unnamed protein product [Parascedosporium putredinis]CAI7991928.1 unnamed protein product [Parascedosporium putredinis]